MKDLVKQRGLDTEFQIASAATSREEIGNDMHPGTKLKLRQAGIPFTRRHAVQLTAADYECYDLIIGMDYENIRYIKRITGFDKGKKIHLLLEYASPESVETAKSDRFVREIADPWYTGNFDETFNDIVTGCNGLLTLSSVGKLTY